jgi:hypothetical protein
MLSDEDHEILADGGWKNSRELANYAFALGVERARRVKPLVWAEINVGESLEAYEVDGFAASYRVYRDPFEDDLPWTAEWSDDYGEGGDGYATLEQAKAACQAHHAAFVLSQLEDA